MEAKVNQQLQEALKHKLRGSAEEVRRMFAALDATGCGFLCEKVGAAGPRAATGTCALTAGSGSPRPKCAAACRAARSLRGG